MLLTKKPVDDTKLKFAPMDQKPKKKLAVAKSTAQPQVKITKAKGVQQAAGSGNIQNPQELPVQNAKSLPKKTPDNTARNIAVNLVKARNKKK